MHGLRTQVRPNKHCVKSFKIYFTSQDLECHRVERVEELKAIAATPIPRTWRRVAAASAYRNTSSLAATARIPLKILFRAAKRSKHHFNFPCINQPKVMEEVGGFVEPKAVACVPKTPKYSFNFRFDASDFAPGDKKSHAAHASIEGIWSFCSRCK